MITVDLPDLGEGVTEGEMVKWLVKVGDEIKADQVIAEIMTDKATVEVPSPYGGKVLELKAQEGDMVPIETPLLVLESQGGSASKKEISSDSKAEALKKEAPQKEPLKERELQNSVGAPSQPLDFESARLSERIMASPSTRKLAREKNIDLSLVPGSGPSGRVTREDVLNFTTSSGSSVSYQQALSPRILGQEQEEREPIRGIRRKIVQSMQLSKKVIPHFTLMDEAVVTELYEVRQQMKEAAQEKGVKVTYLPLVIKALIASCRRYPMLNASIDDEKQEIVYKKFFHVGFAADTPNGLVVPVIQHADQKSILQLSAEIMDLATRAREGKLRPEELKNATITVTNIGTIGGSYATPIINHPQVAILGMYKMVNKPVWDGEGFVPQKTMNFTITADHRLIDGAVAARFLSDFLSQIQSPSKMFLEML